MAELDSESKSLKDSLLSLTSQNDAFEKSSLELQDSANRAGVDVSEKSKEIEALHSEILKNTTNVQNIENSIENQKILIDNFSSRSDIIKQELNQKESDINNTANQLNKLEKDTAEKENNINDLKNKINQLEEKYGSKNVELQKEVSFKNKNNIKLGQITSKQKMLIDMERDLEGYSRGVKNIIKSYQQKKLSGITIHGPLSQLIKVDKKYITAVETALGNTAQNIVTDTPEDAKTAIKYLKQNNLGRATFLPISTIKAKNINNSSAQSYDGYIGTADSLCSCSDIYKPIISSVLSSTVVVDTIDNAVKMGKGCSHRFRIVTLGGDIIQAGGAMTGGSIAKSIGSLSRANEIENLKNLIQLDKSMIEKNTKRIETQSKHRDLLKFMVDYYTMRIEKYHTLADTNQRKKFFVIYGYVPEKYTGRLEDELVRKYNAAVEISDVSEEDNPPVLLKNNSISEPVETVLETYSMPNKHEIDPTFIMSLFYYFLFGMMLSDAGYGLLMIIGCAFVILRYPDMNIGIKKTLKMFFYCGISTFIWGVLFGGFFGDAVKVISTTFFGTSVTIPPLWFEPIKDPMRMLVFSFAVGIVHLFVGLGIKFYQMAKDGDIKGAIYDVVFWYLLVGGGVVYLLTMDMFINMAELTFRLPPEVGTAAAVCAGVGALGIILFAGRSSKNPAKRVAKGLYELYGVTGYLSDILSYSRLLALGLATGVIAQVFNQMGSMFGGGFLGAICFTLVFVIGHTLNMAINLLGAYVHTNRLQFVEFFGKFYEGGGEKFKPFSVHTNYFKFKEEK